MIDYFELSKKQLREIESKTQEGRLPHLLLHVCCGACSCFPLVFLASRFEVDIFYNNSNIYPYEEFMKRKDALDKYLNVYEKAFNKKVDVYVSDYDYEKYDKILSPYKDEPEKGARCQLCINIRLEELFKKAKELNIPYVSTVMTYSKNKDSNFINSLGLQLEKKYNGVHFVVFDFKKNHGQEYGQILAKEYNIYRQSYCGCRYSLINKEKDKKLKEEK